MEGNKIKVSLGTIISIIVIVIIVVLSGILLYKNNKKIAELENTINQQRISNATNSKESTTANNSLNETDETSVLDTNGEKTKFVLPSLFTSNAKKTNSTIDNYSLRVTIPQNDNASFVINVNNGIPTIWTNLEKDTLSGYGLDTDKMKLTKKEQKINGFSKKVVDVLTVFDELQFYAIHFIFLMEDGTIEYSNLQNMLDNVSTQGKLEGLNNIIRLQKVKLSNNGDSSAIAIDKDNNYYDISEFMNEE